MDERLMKIADHYGLDSQLNMLQEECAELIQAVNKYKRGKFANIAEEIADVEIMISQIIYLIDGDDNFEAEINYQKEQKIRRQLARMDGDDHV